MKGFWLGALANAIGSAVGVFLALFLDGVREAHRSNREREKAARQRDEAEAAQWRIAQWLVEENIELAQQAVEAINIGGVFFFQMNTHLLDVATTELATLSTDQELLWNLEHFRYQLHHVNEKIAEQSRAALFQGTPTAEAHRRLRESLLPSIRRQLRDMIIPAAERLQAANSSKSPDAF